jgi:thiamine biosynthesis lipoprotein
MSMPQGGKNVDTIISTRRRSVVLGSFATLALGACGRVPGTQGASGYVKFVGPTMGSSYSVTCAASGHDATQIPALVQATLDEVDARMSMFEPQSELSQLNRAGERAVAVSAELYAVLSAARGVSEWSDGAFDVTVAPLVERWGFGTSSRRQVPPASALAEDRRRVGWRSLLLDPEHHSVTKRYAGTQVDLGGIAQGYGVDAVAAVLERLGIDHYLVDVSGEVRTRGLNPRGEAWRIGIEEPDAIPQRARHIVALSGRAMATSGDYRNYFEQGGLRYSHEIDPASGAPIRHGLASVTVVAGDCVHADAMATALIVLGAARGRALAEATGVAAQFIERGPQGFTDSMTTAFAPLAAVRA